MKNTTTMSHKNSKTEIYHLRRRPGYTQHQFAERLGIQRTALSDYERGIRTPPPRVLRKLRDDYGCDIERLADSDIRALLKDSNSNLAFKSLQINGLRPILKDIEGYH
ncbi:MAG: helix-turn-helix domain-containing protein [Candidatus Poribacteria bacterium]